jgi:hypothetical protein
LQGLGIPWVSFVNKAPKSEGNFIILMGALASD